MNSLSLSIEPVFGTGITELQYISSKNLNGDPRYIFATLDQKTLNFTFRINFAITPDLTLQYYGQPFISTGKYSKIKRIIEPQADNYSDRFQVFSTNQITYNTTNQAFDIDENRDGTTDYSIGNPDFNFRQFRSNFVVRWEYLRGSTIYLVWSQGRTSSASDGSFKVGNDMDELFGVKAHNVFLIKLNYWLSL